MRRRERAHNDGRASVVTELDLRGPGREFDASEGAEGYGGTARRRNRERSKCAGSVQAGVNEQRAALRELLLQAHGLDVCRRSDRGGNVLRRESHGAERGGIERNAKLALRTTEDEDASEPGDAEQLGGDVLLRELANQRLRELGRRDPVRENRLALRRNDGGLDVRIAGQRRSRAPDRLFDELKIGLRVGGRIELDDDLGAALSGRAHHSADERKTDELAFERQGDRHAHLLGRQIARVGDYVDARKAHLGEDRSRRV